MLVASDEHDQVLEALFRVLRQVKQAPVDDPVERPAIIALSRLKANGAMRLSELAEDLYLDASTMSRHVRTLEDNGLVRRAGDPNDRRAVQLTLTEDGLGVLAEAWANRRTWIDRAVATWSAADRRELGAVLTRFADALAADAAARAAADAAARDVGPARTRTEPPA